jgi:hypothetical protein
MEFKRTQQAAEFMRLQRKTLENWRSQGRGPAYVKVGGRVLYPVADLEAFVAANRHVPQSETSAA